MPTTVLILELTEGGLRDDGMQWQGNKCLIAAISCRRATFMIYWRRRGILPLAAILPDIALIDGDAGIFITDLARMASNDAASCNMEMALSFS